MLTSIAAPIMRNGKFQGSVTSDFSLATLQKRIGAIKPWDGVGYAVLLSAENNVVSSPDKAAIGKPYKGTITGSEVVRFDDPQLGEPAFITWRTIAVGNSGTPWKLAIITPVSVVMAEAWHFLMNAIVMMVLSIIIVSLVVALVFTRKVARPVGGEPSEAAEIALSVAQGDLSSTIPCRGVTAAASSTRCTPCRGSCTALSAPSPMPATRCVRAVAKLPPETSISLHAPKSRRRRLCKPRRAWSRLPSR